jgi:myo-inositol-1(or 4)-monophosphatase
MKEFIITLARDAGTLALKYVGESKVFSKGNKNIVTEADLVVEKLITDQIKKKFPDHTIVAEESDNLEKDSDYTWYIDPIDGTSNYAHGDPNFCVSIALAENNELKYGCIYIPMLKEMYFAEKGKGTELNGNSIKVSNVDKLDHAFVHVGISPFKSTIDDSLKIFKHFMLNADRARDYGFCAGQLAHIASGKADALIKRSQHSWDIAAGILLIEEAGGKVTDEHGNKINLKNSRHHLIASNGVLHDTILEEIQKMDVKPIDNEIHWHA